MSSTLTRKSCHRIRIEARNAGCQFLALLCGAQQSCGSVSCLVSATVPSIGLIQLTTTVNDPSVTRLLVGTAVGHLRTSGTITHILASSEDTTTESTLASLGFTPVSDASLLAAFPSLDLQRVNVVAIGSDVIASMAVPHPNVPLSSVPLLSNISPEWKNRWEVIDTCVNELKQALAVLGKGESLCDCMIRSLVNTVPYQLQAVLANASLTGVDADVIVAVREVQNRHPDAFKEQDILIEELAAAASASIGRGFNVKALGTPSLVAAKFDKLSPHWEEFVTAAGYSDVWHWLAELSLKPLLERKPAVPLASAESKELSVIDMCCGVGLPGQLLRFMGYQGRLVGCDISAGMLDKASLRYCYDELYCADVNVSLNVPQASADVIVCTGSMELLNIPVALGQCHMALKPGGELWVSFQWREHGSGKGNPTEHQNIRCLCRQEISDLLARTGFMLVEDKECSKAFITPKPGKEPGQMVLQEIPYLFCRAKRVDYGKAVCNVCKNTVGVDLTVHRDRLVTVRCRDNVDVTVIRTMQKLADTTDLMAFICCSGCRMILDRYTSARFEVEAPTALVLRQRQPEEEALVLTNCGHKRALCIAQELSVICKTSEEAQKIINTSPESSLLLATAAAGSVDWKEGDVLMQELVQNGMACRVPAPDAVGMKWNYQRNPLENVHWMVYEYTNRCAMTCYHCYNSTRGEERNSIEERPELLCSTSDSIRKMGVEHFWFIGGEVTQFGDGWLEVARHISKARGTPRLDLPFGRPSPTIVEIITSGWFLDKTNFKAAGKTYKDADALLRDLKENGVSHICYSLDAPTADLHDANRKTPGLFDRIFTTGFAKAREAGLEVSVSVLVRPEWKTDPSLFQFLAQTAMLLYGNTIPDPVAAITKLITDPTNLLLPFIDIGTGAKKVGSKQEPALSLEIVSKRGLARCKAFYKAGLWISLKANGNFSLCRILSGADEGFGNVRDCKGGIVELLNTLQDKFLYQVHSDGTICEYVRFVDPILFGDSFLHPCAARAVVSLIAKLMHDRNVEPTDTEAIKAINKEVAALTGYEGPADSW